MSESFKLNGQMVDVDVNQEIDFHVTDGTIIKAIIRRRNSGDTKKVFFKISGNVHQYFTLLPAAVMRNGKLLDDSSCNGVAFSDDLKKAALLHPATDTLVGQHSSRFIESEALYRSDGKLLTIASVEVIVLDKENESELESAN